MEARRWWNFKVFAEYMKYSEMKVPHNNMVCTHRTYDDGRTVISSGFLSKDDPNYVEPNSFREFLLTVRLLINVLIFSLLNKIKILFIK